MESRDGKCDPFDGVYSRVSFNLLRLETNALLSQIAHAVFLMAGMLTVDISS